MAGVEKAKGSGAQRESKPGAKRSVWLGRRLFNDLGGNTILLFALVLLLTTVPFSEGGDAEGAVSRLVWSAAIVAGIVKASGRRVFLVAAIVIAIPSLLGRWIDLLGFSKPGPLLVALFFALISAHILTDIFSRHRIQLDQIIGGVNVYLLLGVIFSYVHLAVEERTPNSYMLGSVPLAVAAEAEGQDLEDVLLYFSFTSLTSLGFGDIRPVSQVARMLSTAEAVIGQLFVAILIARLVGAHARSALEDDDGP